MQESPCLKPDWFEQMSLFSIENWNISVIINLPRTFPQKVTVTLNGNCSICACPPFCEWEQCHSYFPLGQKNRPLTENHTERILSTYVYWYYHDCALCSDLGFELRLQFNLERNLKGINNCLLSIEYAKGVSCCCLLKSLYCKMRIKELRIVLKICHKFTFIK